MTTYRSRIPQLLTLLLVLFFFALARPAAAQTQTYFWEQFNVDVEVLENGDLRVTEQQVLNFGGAPFSFGFREIPTGFSGRNDGISDVSVTEGATAYRESNARTEYTFRVERDSDSATIYWYFPPALGSRAYTISYTVHGGVRTEPSGDQIFWNAMPGDLGAPINSGRVTITVPEGIEILSTTALVGGDEDRGISTAVSEDGRTAEFFLTQPRPAGRDVEAGVRFPSGQLQVSVPSWQEREQTQDVIGLIALIISALILVGGPAAALLLWYLFGRDPEEGLVVPSYLSEPPDDTPPAVVGTLVDERAHIHDIMATLVDLARRGYLTMTEKGKSDFTFTRTDKPTGDLRPFEQSMLTAIFGKRRERHLSNLKYKFAEKLPGLRRELYEELQTRGFVRRSPETTRNAYGCLAGLILGAAGLIFFLAIALTEGNIATAFCPGIALGITGAVFLWVAQHMPAKTVKGAEAKAKWLAFKAYLQDIEKHSSLEGAGEIFEKYLPYAIVFGLERSWIRKFAAMPNTPMPGWYFPVYGPIYTGSGSRPRPGVGTPGAGGMPTLEGMSGGLTGGLENMSSGLTRMLTSTQTVLQSTPPSSSSGGGGSFSGGFSGGSSGGGGGGFG